MNHREMCLACQGKGTYLSMGSGTVCVGYKETCRECGGKGWTDKGWVAEEQGCNVTYNIPHYKITVNK